VSETKCSESDLNVLLCCEGETRKSFETYIESLTVVKYSLERNESGEYKQAAMFHMWTGYCIAKAI